MESKIEFTREEVNKLGNLLGQYPASQVYWGLNLCITKVQEFDERNKNSNHNKLEKIKNHGSSN